MPPQRLEHHIPLKKLAIACFAACWCLSAWATKDTVAKRSLFKLSNAAPPGFENIEENQTQTTLVSVFFGNRLVTNTMATFNDQTITFEQPSDITDHLKGLTDKKTVLAALSNPMPTNADKLCSSARRVPYCETIKPATIGVIFDPNAIKAYLFVNPKYIEANQIKPNTLPPSTAGSSLVSHNHLIYSKRTGKTYAFNTDTYAGSGSAYGLLKTYYTHQTSPTTDETTDLLRLTELSGQYYHNGNLYSAGVIPTGGDGMFTQSVSMIGVMYQNHFDRANIANPTQGTPVIIFLPTPSKVEVYRAGELIYANDYPAGKHQIDTRSFPIGSYDITIRMTNSIGQITEERQFFVKRLNGMDSQSVRYRIAGGDITRNDISIDRSASKQVQLPEFSNESVFSLDRDQLLGTRLDWNINALSNISRTFLATEFRYFGHQYDIAPGVVVSTNRQYGVGLESTLNRSPYSMNMSAVRFWGTGRILDDQNSKAFLPLSASKYFVSLNGNLTYPTNSFGLYARWQQNVNAAYSQTLTFSYAHQLYRSSMTGLSFSLNASKTQDDKIISLGLNATFNTTYVDGNARLAYKRDNIGTGQKENNSFAQRLDLRKRINFDKTHHLAWSASVDNDHVGTDYSAKADYISVPLRARASTTYNMNKSSDNAVSQTVQIDSSVAYADGHFGVGYHGNKNAGIIVDVHSPEDGQTQILANNRPIATVANNTATPIFLSPYKTYNITINPQGSGTQFSFDNNPKAITLYRGNIQRLDWTLESRYILFAEIVDQQGEPIPLLLLDQKGKYNTTDDFGYIQADIPEGISELSFISMDGETCSVSLPKGLKPEDGLLVLDNPLVCHIAKGSS